jgi:hypothetical protein
MRTEIDIDRGGGLHERVKDYARENNVRMPRAYAELISVGVECAGDDQ